MNNNFQINRLNRNIRDVKYKNNKQDLFFVKLFLIVLVIYGIAQLASFLVFSNIGKEATKNLLTIKELEYNNQEIKSELNKINNSNSIQDLAQNKFGFVRAGITQVEKNDNESIAIGSAVVNR